MAKYIIKYASAVEIEAKNSDEAIDKAWIDEGVSGEDITDIILDK